MRATHRIKHCCVSTGLKGSRRLKCGKAYESVTAIMKVFALCALAVAAYAVDVSEMRLINDQAFVDKINSNPGLLWKVCFLPSGMLLCLTHALPFVLTLIDMSCVGCR